MPEPRANAFQALLLFVLGAGGSIAVGYLWAGDSVFKIHATASGFMFDGLGCAFVFALHRWRGLIPALGAGLLLSLLLGFLFSSLFLTVFIHSILKMFAAALVSDLVWGKIFTRLLFGKFIYTAIVLSAASLVATLILIVVYSLNLFRDVMVVNTAQGFLVGLGLGLGFEIAELCCGSAKKPAVE
ncbi:MAG: hypothetical protein GY867_04895 [bacterium]|nr:hypothetical protein [bacterium]